MVNTVKKKTVDEIMAERLENEKKRKAKKELEKAQKLNPSDSNLKEQTLHTE